MTAPKRREEEGRRGVGKGRREEKKMKIEIAGLLYERESCAVPLESRRLRV